MVRGLAVADTYRVNRSPKSPPAMPFVTGWRGLNERGRSSGRNQACLTVNGRLDQLEDRLSGTQEAGGSNPPASTIGGLSETFLIFKPDR